MSKRQTATLASGQNIPLVGYGTWQASPGEVGQGVLEALKAGYRHLDLAKCYQNQPEVAQGIKKAYAEVPGLKREDIFITSKLWNNSHHPDDVEKALDETLAELELQYLDLYLIHWPVAFARTTSGELNPLAETGDQIALDPSIAIIDTWKAMIQLPTSRVRGIGVSNFTPAHIDALIKATGVSPLVNQVERHPLLHQNNTLIAYANDKNIHITGYSGFGNNNRGAPMLLEHPTIKDIASSMGASAAQVLIAWAQVGGHSVIPKSVTPSRIQSNFQEVELSSSDIEKINGIGDVPLRYNVPTTFQPNWDINIWNDELEKNATNNVTIGVGLGARF